MYPLFDWHAPLVEWCGGRKIKIGVPGSIPVSVCFVPFKLQHETTELTPVWQHRIEPPFAFPQQILQVTSELTLTLTLTLTNCDCDCDQPESLHAG